MHQPAEIKSEQNGGPPRLEYCDSDVGLSTCPKWGCTPSTTAGLQLEGLDYLMLLVHKMLLLHFIIFYVWVFLTIHFCFLFLSCNFFTFVFYCILITIVSHPECLIIRGKWWVYTFQINKYYLIKVEQLFRPENWKVQRLISEQVRSNSRFPQASSVLSQRSCANVYLRAEQTFEQGMKCEVVHQVGFGLDHF